MPKDTNKKKDNKKQDSKNKKHFMKDFKAELKRVIWPTPKQLLNNTVAVITVVIITAAIVFVLDLAFESMNKYGIDKLKTMVDASNVVESSNTVSVDDSSSNTTTSNTTADENNTNETKASEEETNAVSEESNNVEE